MLATSLDEIIEIAMLILIAGFRLWSRRSITRKDFRGSGANSIGVGVVDDLTLHVCVRRRQRPDILRNGIRVSKRESLESRELTLMILGLRVSRS